jgi:hypothetical protein
MARPILDPRSTEGAMQPLVMTCRCGTRLKLRKGDHPGRIGRCPNCDQAVLFTRPLPNWSQLIAPPADELGPARAGTIPAASGL